MARIKHFEKPPNTWVMTSPIIILGVGVGLLPEKYVTETVALFCLSAFLSHFWLIMNALKTGFVKYSTVYGSRNDTPVRFKVIMLGLSLFTLIAASGFWGLITGFIRYTN
jgi:hypothetical protein